MPKSIRVLIVDDSTLARQALSILLSADPGIEVIGEARDGKEGYAKAIALKPDVITMDITMPVMDGLEATKLIMEKVPTPIIIVSSREVRIIVKALSFGAMDFVASTGDLEDIRDELLEKVKIASRVKALRRMHFEPIAKRTTVPRNDVVRMVALGVSTGGPQALQVVISTLPADLPACVLVVQHISEGFIQGLVEWLSLTSHLNVRVAQAGDEPKSGTVYFAPDGFHMIVNSEGKIALKENLAKKMIHVPSIDVMMQSVAAVYRENAVGVIMTGMGRDGVEGMTAIKAAGGFTIAQDEKTSAIYGMNKIAVDQGVVASVQPLNRIADEILRAVK